MRKRRKGILALALMLLVLVAMTGCDYSYFMIDKDSDASEADTESESEKNFIYLNKYQDMKLVLPKGWSITEDRASYLRAASSVASMTIVKKEGKAAMSVLPFPQNEGDVAVFIANQPSYQITSEDGSTRVAEYTLNEFDGNSIALTEDQLAYYYNFMVTRSDGFIDQFIGVKQYETAYAFTITFPQGQKQEELLDDFSSFEFVNNSELTAALMTCVSDLETIDLSDLKNKENERTCLSAVNVRTEPNTSNSQVLGGLSPGDKIIITGEEGNWYMFEYNGRKAYVYKDYFE